MTFQHGDVSLYYEKIGQGPAIILLHGNSENSGIFDVLTRQLAPHYTVYAIDSRDHGKSSKVKVLNYADMMEDVAAFVRELKLEKPVLLGFSDGGIIGLLLAMKYPDMLGKLIAIGANLSPRAVKWQWRLAMNTVFFFTRSRKFRLMLNQPNITAAQLGTITTPTLVLAGSKDVVSNAHTELIAQSIPGSTLKILEGENHVSYVLHSEKLYHAISPFLSQQ
ncbi:MAG: alpha/beta hydrolase [Oscillospiraceae bacterium]|nr:alpha/beta hydrolase [Oscillospiraceae bacterium]